jgi:hypothetical protein
MHPDQELIDTAYDWHEGGYPLYQFASLGGLVVSEQHRADLIEAIQGDIDWCRQYATDDPEAYRREYADEPDRLAELIDYIRSAPIATRRNPEKAAEAR